MGGVKEAMLIHEGYRNRATSYLIKTGKLDHCEMHGFAHGGGYDELDRDFWRIAMADRNRGEYGPIPWASELEAREFTDIVKEAYEEHCADSCGYCDKLMAD